jgi:hypothetical protein
MVQFEGIQGIGLFLEMLKIQNELIDQCPEFMAPQLGK